MDPLIRRVASVQIRRRPFPVKQKGIANVNSCDRDYSSLVRHAAVVQSLHET